MQEKINAKKCPICKQDTYGLFQDKEDLMCIFCRRQLKFTKSSHVLYDYNDFFKEMLFQYKAMGDLALAPLFLWDFRKKLRHRYRGYTIVLVPSLPEDNFKRGFAFLPWIFQCLQLPMISPFYKKTKYKQATSKHREKVADVIAIKEGVFVRDKKLLLVDDVMTSGNTLKTCICLLEQYHPQVIDYLVLAAKKENIQTCINTIEEGRLYHERKSKKIFNSKRIRFY